MSLGNMIRNTLARGVVRLVMGSLKMQGLQVEVLDGELLEPVEHAEPFGFTSFAPAGAEAFMGFMGGDRSHPVALIVSHRAYRPTDLKEGESCQYSKVGQRVHLKENEMFINAAGLPVVVHNAGKITLDAPTTEATGDLLVAGQVLAGGDIIDRAYGAGRTMAQMRNTYDNHDHNDSIGGKTTAPNQKTGD